jgi:hypothetical protein
MSTLASVATSKTVVMLANEVRCMIVSELFARLAKSLFTVRKIPSKRQHPDHVGEYMELYELRLLR